MFLESVDPALQSLQTLKSSFNSVNLRCGYIQLDIRSPKEIVSNEDET